MGIEERGLNQSVSAECWILSVESKREKFFTQSSSLITQDRINLLLEQKEGCHG
jgi:hypothetical protein